MMRPRGDLETFAGTPAWQSQKSGSSDYLRSTKGKDTQAIIISPEKIVILLGAIIVLLGLAHIAGQLITFLTGHKSLHGILPQFNLDEENNIPTYFSSVILLFSSSLLGVIANLKRNRRDRYAFHWTMLAIIFLYLSLDEMASLHEMLIVPMRHVFGIKGLFHYAWVIPFIPLVLLFAASYLRFLFHLPVRTRLLFAIAGLIYVGGAMGIECIGGWYHGLYGRKDLTFGMLVLLEEMLEMIGVTIFIYGLLDYMREETRPIQFSIEKPG